MDQAKMGMRLRFGLVVCFGLATQSLVSTTIRISIER
jgi:hypothetical protein